MLYTILKHIGISIPKCKIYKNYNNKSIYKFGLSVLVFVCLSVCLFVSNKRQNGWTDRAQIFCGTSRDPREGLWAPWISSIVKITNKNNIEHTLHMNEMLMFLILKTNYFNRGFSTDVTVQENNRNYHS